MIRRLLVGNVRGELACLRPEGIHLLLNGAFLTLRVTFGKTKVSYLNSALLVKENVVLQGEESLFLLALLLELLLVKQH